MQRFRKGDRVMITTPGHNFGKTGTVVDIFGTDDYPNYVYPYIVQIDGTRVTIPYGENELKSPGLDFVPVFLVFVVFLVIVGYCLAMYFAHEPSQGDVLQPLSDTISRIPD